MNLTILALKTDRYSSFLRPVSSLFHSMIIDGNVQFLKKFWIAVRRGMFSAFLVEYNVRLKGIKLKRY